MGSRYVRTGMVVATALAVGGCLLSIDDSLVDRQGNSPSAVDGGSDSDGAVPPPPSQNGDAEAGALPGPADAAVFLDEQPGLGQIVTGDDHLAWVTSSILRTCPVAGCPDAGSTIVNSPDTGELTGILASAGATVYDIEHSGSSWTLRGCPFGDCDLNTTYFGSDIGPLLPGAPFVTDGSESFVVQDNATTDIRTCTNLACTWKKVVSPGGEIFAFALTATKILWTEKGANGKILSCLRSGCASPTVVKSGLADPRGLVTDETNLYFTTLDDGTVMTCPVDDCTAPTKLAAAYAPSRLVRDGDTLFWLEGDGKIGTVKTNGNGARIFSNGVTGASQIAVTPTRVFFTSGTTIYVVPRASQ